MDPVTLMTLIGTIGGMIIPPVFDFVKKKFVPAQAETVESTMGNLATTKPETLPAYTQSLALYWQAQTTYFNRDVAGTPSQIIIDIRAGIRPFAVILSFAIIVLGSLHWITIDPASRVGCFTIIGNWVGSRIT
jgi:hypothetical protein